MSNQFKKYLTTAAAALMLTSVGVNISNLTSPTTSYAAKKHQKKHKNKKHKKHNKKKVNGESEVAIGNWYVNNADSLYSKFNNQGAFSQGQWNASGSPVMRLDLYKNKQYREGWIITYANGMDRNVTPAVDNGGTIINYEQANKLYEAGVKLIETKHAKYNPKLNVSNGTWSINYQRSINDDNNVTN